MDAKVLKFLNKQSKNVENVLKSFDKVKIIFDRDVDGLMSCLIVYKVLKKLNKKVECISTKVNELENLLEKQKDNESLYIFLDLALEETFVKKIREKNLKSIWIDHHQLKIFSYKQIIFINPLFLNSNIYIPTSAISYILFDRIYHLEDLIFFSAVGIVADKGHKDAESILRKFKQKYSNKFDLEKVVMKVNSLFILNLKIEKLVSKLVNVDFFRSKYLEKIYKKTQKILKEELERALKYHEKFNNFALFRVGYKYNTRSTIASILSENEKFSKYVIIVYSMNKDVKISLRNGKESKINLFEFLKSLRNKVEFKSFGGHKNACGATLSKKEFKKFLKELEKYGSNK